ncbi:MAG: N-acetylmuramoyl-L-alanine amidase, partial [uncultured Rubrobacteraceae bacterium]
GDSRLPGFQLVRSILRELHLREPSLLERHKQDRCSRHAGVLVRCLELVQGFARGGLCPLHHPLLRRRHRPVGAGEGHRVPRRLLALQSDEHRHRARRLRLGSQVVHRGYVPLFREALSLPLQEVQDPHRPQSHHRTRRSSGLLRIGWRRRLPHRPRRQLELDKVHELRSGSRWHWNNRGIRAGGGQRDLGALLGGDQLEEQLLWGNRQLRGDSQVRGPRLHLRPRPVQDQGACQGHLRRLRLVAGQHRLQRPYAVSDLHGERLGQQGRQSEDQRREVGPSWPLYLEHRRCELDPGLEPLRWQGPHRRRRSQDRAQV